MPRANLGVGTTIGGFRIEKKLGAGGMGEVYLAKQLSMDRDVAFKVLPSHLSLRQDLADRFLNELKLLARLDHPNIVAAHDAGEDGGVLYFAMAYIRGESLAERLRRGGFLKEPEALGIARKLAGALAYAWNRHQLLHRDIKPSNVLLDENGEPKLVDFGLAKSLAADVNLTRGSVMLGTPNYMSPEMAGEDVQADVRTDMYSLGATLYNMVTGAVPFAGSSVMEVIKKQMLEPLPDPREYNPELSDGCVELLEIMLSKDWEQRHGSWESLLADIERVQAGQHPTKQVPDAGSSTLMRIRDKGMLDEVKKRMLEAKGGKAAPGIAVAPKGEEGDIAESGNSVRRGLGVWGWVGVAAAAVAVIAGLISFGSKGGKSRAHEPMPSGAYSSVVTNQSAAVVADERIFKLGRAYTSAIEFKDTHPKAYAEAIDLFEALRKDAAGTEYEGKASEQIQRLEAGQRQAPEAVWSGLKAEARQLAAAGKHTAAIELLEKYSGPLASETASNRAVLVVELKAKQAEMIQAQEAEAAEKRAAEARESEDLWVAEAQAKLTALLEAAAGDMLKGEYPAATRRRGGSKRPGAFIRDQ